MKKLYYKCPNCMQPVSLGEATEPKILELSREDHTCPICGYTPRYSERVYYNIFELEVTA